MHDGAPPSKEEVHSHPLTHLYRTWFKCRVKGRVDDVRHTSSDNQMMFPVMPLDYTYLTESEDNANPILAGHDDNIDNVMAWAVPSRVGGGS